MSLKFSNKEEALQYLADMTSKKVIIAACDKAFKKGDKVIVGPYTGDVYYKAVVVSQPHQDNVVVEFEDKKQEDLDVDIVMHPQDFHNFENLNESDQVLERSKTNTSPVSYRIPLNFFP